ncbi:MAG: OsmC family protein [Chloroflexi bacterium]|jgi:uncharacterized OsmC-like protein|nr:OsmC family protein [Anaerolineaceae bacterium]NMB87350.1 OsmC family protein [Chloroflexota bacterium]
MPVKQVSVKAVQTNGFTIEAHAHQHTVVIDQPLNAGGKDCGPTPLEYLFFSLSGCIITIGHIIAQQQKLNVRNISVDIEGELNTDVLLGRSTEVRPGFTGIRLVTHIDADMTQAEKEQFLHDIDARCPISDNVANLTPIELVAD